MNRDTCSTCCSYSQAKSKQANTFACNTVESAKLQHPCVTPIGQFCTVWVPGSVQPWDINDININEKAKNKSQISARRHFRSLLQTCHNIRWGIKCRMFLTFSEISSIDWMAEICKFVSNAQNLQFLWTIINVHPRFDAKTSNNL